MIQLLIHEKVIIFELLEDGKIIPGIDVELLKFETAEQAQKYVEENKIRYNNGEMPIYWREEIEIIPEE